MTRVRKAPQVRRDRAALARLAPLARLGRNLTSLDQQVRKAKLVQLVRLARLRLFPARLDRLVRKDSKAALQTSPARLVRRAIPAALARRVRLVRKVCPALFRRATKARSM